MTYSYEYHIMEIEVPVTADGDPTPSANDALDALESALRVVVIQSRTDKAWNPLLFEEYYDHNEPTVRERR